MRKIMNIMSGEKVRNVDRYLHKRNSNFILRGAGCWINDMLQSVLCVALRLIKRVTKHVHMQAGFLFSANDAQNHQAARVHNTHTL